MDILDILLDILLKPPQPFIGLFLTIDVLCITDNFEHSFDILTFDFLLKPPQPTTGIFLNC